MDNLTYPFTYGELTDEENRIANLLEKYHPSPGIDYLRVIPTNYVVRTNALKYGSALYNFKPRKDDIWLLGYPRSGTTLMQEILYLLGTNLNYHKAASKVLDIRFPFLEHVLVMNEKELEFYKEISKKKNLTADEELSLPPHVRLAKHEGKRFIKSHRGFILLNPKLLEVGCKVVFIARNIKDVIISILFNPTWNIPENELQETFTSIWLMFKHGLTPNTNYFEMLKEAWERRNNPNLLILFYEEVIEDKHCAIQKVADFLGVSISEEQIERLVDHVDIEKFRENDSVNNDHLVKLGVYTRNNMHSHIREGKSGGWRDRLTPEMNAEFDELIRSEFEKIPGFMMPQCWKDAMDLDDE